MEKNRHIFVDVENSLAASVKETILYLSFSLYFALSVIIQLKIQ